MTLSAPYRQLNEYIAAKTKQPISISFVNEKEIKVSYTRKILFKEINIGINIKVEKVNPSGIVLSYQAPAGLDMVITGAISFLNSKLPELAPGIHLEGNRNIRINLEEIEKAEPIIENISLQDITFSDSTAAIEFSLKY